MINAAIFGMGRWGQTLIGSVQGTSEKIRFTKGVSINPSKYEKFTTANNIDLLDSYQAVLSDPDTDAVVLATPHSMHVEHVTLAAASGKHVFVENPLSLTVSGAKECLEACANAQVILAVGFNQRFRPAFSALKELRH